MATGLLLAPGPVAGLFYRTGTTLAGLLALGRVGDGVAVVVVVVTLDSLVGPPLTGLNRLLRWVGLGEAIAAVANQVLPPGLDERFPHGESIIWLKELHERPLHLAIPKPLGHID